MSTYIRNLSDVIRKLFRLVLQGDLRQSIWKKAESPRVSAFARTRLTVSLD